MKRTSEKPKLGGSAKMAQQRDSVVVKVGMVGDAGTVYAIIYRRFVHQTGVGKTNYWTAYLI
jgi:hypothetical protein